MSVANWTWIIVGLTFAAYIFIAAWAKARSAGDFYVAQKSIHPVFNGMATGADWISAASFVSMAGVISFMGRDGAMYLIGWTGGFVLLAVLIAPYLRKFGRFTVPEFIGTRYYSDLAGTLGVFCAVFISSVYISGQMRGVGVIFSRFLGVSVDEGVYLGMGIVFFYAVLGGMKGVTYTQAMQYVVLVIAYLIPPIFFSIMLTGNPLPFMGLGSTISPEGAALLGDQGVSGKYLLTVLDDLNRELGFSAYTAGGRNGFDLLMITLALMIGTAGLPHVIIRFFTVPRVRDARASVGWALMFICVFYLTAPSMAAFCRTYFIKDIHNQTYESSPEWFRNWEKTGLVAWVDKNGDGKLQYYAGNAFEGAPVFTKELGKHGEPMLKNRLADNKNEVYVDPDMIVLAGPEMAFLPNWVPALVAAGALAAALSTAAGLLLVISSAVSHDLIKNIFIPGLSDKNELTIARVAAGVAVVVAGYFGINPPGFVAQVVAFAFGLAASSLFPPIVAGIYSKRATKEGAMAGMVAGLLFTSSYIMYFTYLNPTVNDSAHWLWGISPEGIGTVGMALNFAVLIIVSSITKPPPEEIVEMVESIRFPREDDEEDRAKLKGRGRLRLVKDD